MANNRIASVDFLRGITICAMILVNTPGSWSHVYAPLLHAKWHGLTPTDLIFPFFIFIVGISIYFAYKNKKGTKETYKKITIRSLKLIGLGLFLNLFIPNYPFFTDLETFRIPGVLQRIGLVFFFASVLYLNFNWKIILAITIFILLGYYYFLSFIPLPNSNLPTLNNTLNNWANYVDVSLFGKHLWQPNFDPEGFLSTITAIVTCLIGVLIGKVLHTLKNIKFLFLIAILLLVIGYLSSFWFPINKTIWTSSFVLVTSGYGTLFLAIIYYFKDIKQYKFGISFKYVGMNAIVLYFLSSFISKTFYLIKINETQNIHSFIYEKIFVNPLFSDKFSSLLYAISVVLFYVILAHILFKKKIIIKV